MDLCVGVCVRVHNCIYCFLGVSVCQYVCICVCYERTREKSIWKKKLYQRKSLEKKKNRCDWVKVLNEAWILCNVFCFLNLGGCPQCPSLLLYVLYQNITIECWPACLYPSNKGDFLSVSVCEFLLEKLVPDQALGKCPLKSKIWNLRKHILFFLMCLKLI